MVNSVVDAHNVVPQMRIPPTSLALRQSSGKRKIRLILLIDLLSVHLTECRRSIFALTIFFFASAIGSACSKVWKARIIARVCMGYKATTMPVFAAGISPAHIRGMVQQAFGVVQLRVMQAVRGMNTSKAITKWDI